MRKSFLVRAGHDFKKEARLVGEMRCEEDEFQSEKDDASEREREREGSQV